MRYVFMVLLGGLVMAGCAKERMPPIQLEVIAAPVSKQLTERIGEHFVKVGKVQYNAETNVYHLEVFYKQHKQDKVEQRYVLVLTHSFDTERQLLTYIGQFPRNIIGEGDPGGRSYFPDVMIDETMNQ